MPPHISYAPKNSYWLIYSYLALVAWLPIPLGSKHPWATSIAEVWCYLIATAIIILWIRTPHPLPTAFKTAKVVIVILALNITWLLFQCLLIPQSWLQTLSPLALDLYNQTDTNYISISLDRSITLYQVQIASYLLTFFCLTLYLINSRKRIKWLIYTILFSALIQVMYGAMMVLNGTEYSFFISKSALHSHIGSATGTFTNRDHLAGYLEIALALGIGYMLTMLSRMNQHRNWKQQIKGVLELLLGPKARLRLILILLCLGLVLTHSRGGNLAFFISLGVAGALYLILVRKKTRATIIFLSSLIILDIVIIGSLVGVSKVVDRLGETTFQTEKRDDAYIATYPMIEDYFITGIGSGNYFNTFPSYKSPQLSGYWNHAHNDYLEIMTEQGIIGFSLLAATVLYSLFMTVKIFRKRNSSFKQGISFASLMGITAILIHSTVDFNLQILANSSMFMILLALPFICHKLKYQQSYRN